MRLGVFVVLLAGCGRVAFEPLGDGGPGDGPMAACPGIPQCPDHTEEVAIGSTSVTLPVMTNHGLSTPACSSGNGNPELAVMFTPLDDATYTVRVTPALSAVYIQDTCCGGPELVCGQNPATLERRRGERFVVVVENLPGTGVTVQVDGN